MSPWLGTERWRRWSVWRMRRRLLALLRRSPESFRQPFPTPTAGENPFVELDAAYFWVWGHLREADRRALLLDVIEVSGLGLSALSDHYLNDLLPRLQRAEQARTEPPLPCSRDFRRFRD